jgi:hypothetical protein
LWEEHPAGSPVRDADRLGRARYVDFDGIARQAGRFERCR